MFHFYISFHSPPLTKAFRHFAMLLWINIHCRTMQVGWEKHKPDECHTNLVLADADN